MINENEFMEIIFPLLYDLSFDKIDNVRMTISKILNIIIKKNKIEYNWILNNKEIKLIKKFNDKVDIIQDVYKINLVSLGSNLWLNKENIQ